MYADVTFYKETYHGNSIPDDAIANMLERASMDIDVITRRRIHKLGGFDALSEFEQTQLRWATCYQADHIYSVGDMDGVTSYSIGDVSASLSADSTCRYNRNCMNYLNQTRLIKRYL